MTDRATSDPVHSDPVSNDLILSKRKDDLLWVTLNQPNKANALSPALSAQLTGIYSRDWRREGVRAILLRGNGRHFSAGADLGHLASLKDAGAEENARDSAALRDLFESILRQETLTVAMVQGSCIAGGCGLATANDYVVATESARFLYSEVRIGFVAALVATFLPLRVRGRDLREMLLNPQLLSADRALELGLANRVVADDALESSTLELVEEILTTASSESIARTKRLLLEVHGLPLSDALDAAEAANAAARATEDCKHGIATFLETKKPPNWR